MEKVQLKNYCIVCLCVIIFGLFNFSAYATTYYVSNSGNDANSGLTTALPWKTLTKVNSAAFQPGDQILFQRGSTFYGTLTVKNSGTAGSPITYGAFGTGANPIITGFTQVSSWTNLGSNIWESTNAVSTLENLNIVTINGVNTAMGRTPNSGSVYTAQTHNANLSITSNNLNGTPNWTGAQLVIRKNASTWQIGTVTGQTVGTVSYTDEGNFTPSNNCGFFFQADSRTLDIQNEWYYNPITKKIKIYSTFQPVNVAVPTIVVLSDNYAKNYINIDGITFQGANSTALIFNACNNITITNCKINKIGLVGIQFYNTSTYTINNNFIKNCNYSAVFSYAGTKNTNESITNNIIDSTYMIIGVGRLYPVAALHSNTDVSLVQYNMIQHSGYNGIMHTGLTGQIRNNFINYSLLNRSDGGGIYTSVETTNLVIDSNVILNSIGYPLGEQYGYVGTRGIYLDSNTAYVTVSNNTIAHCWDGIYLSSGTDHNTISGNTVFNNTRAALVISNSFQAAGSVNNNIVSNNKFIAKSINTGIKWYNDQMCLWMESSFNDITTFISSATGNYYARPLSDTYTIKLSQPNVGTVLKTLEEWQSFSGQDANSKKSPQSITTENDFQFEYNETKLTKTVSLIQPMIDVKGTKYVGSVILQPFTSIVLMKDLTPAVAPGTPTSVVAIAGNTSATVTFAAPTNNGGSTITGYTVTSIPAGGTDLNAGSTSLSHTITGLTNGTSYTFTVRATNSVGTSAASAPSNSVIPSAPVATSFTFSGPSAGNVNSASANFTVTPNNPYTGTITITPTGSGSTGLTTKVLTFSNSSAAQTFSITPTVAGSTTLTPTNNGALTNPAILTYTANAVVPAAPTSIVAIAGNASSTVSFAAPTNNGGSAITGYTVTSIPAGGIDNNAGSTSLTHTITGLTNGTSYTFTVKATNIAGTSVASAVSNAVTPSASFDIIAPVISAFIIPASSSSLTIPISTFNASDNVGVTGYLLTETSTKPSSTATGWSITKPTSYTFTSGGTKFVYAWAKDAAGNVSASITNQVVISLPSYQLGNTEVYSGTSTAANRRAIPVTFSEAGSIQSISIYHNGGTGNVLLGVYSDQAGIPASHLGVTQSTIINTTAGWQTVSLAYPVNVTAGQTVWLAWVFQNNPGVRYTSGTPGRAQSTSTWTGGLPATFGTSTILGNKFSIYCTYTVNTTTLKNANIPDVLNLESASPLVGNDNLMNTDLTDESSNQLLGKNDFKLYPNPAKTFINIVYTYMPERGTTIEIIDGNGKKIFEQLQVSLSNRIDINKFTSGIYIIRSINNQEYNVKKLIVQ